MKTKKLDSKRVHNHPKLLKHSQFERSSQYKPGLRKT
jgi:hypothetical protein